MQISLGWIIRYQEWSMDQIVVTGGSVLRGVVSVSGAKNSALPIIFSTLLCPGDHDLENIPELMDVFSAIQLMESLGCYCHFENHRLKIRVEDSLKTFACYDQVRKMRASILVLGPLLARFGQVRVSLPGGCAIGARPIQMHLSALEKMGAKISVSEGYVIAKAPFLKGAVIDFDFPTVGGTENILMAGSLARGTTIINNAACEPEIEDLANYLSKMGVLIQGAGTATIKIKGQSHLTSGKHRIISDRIEAGTFITATAMTGGEVTLKNCRPEHLKNFMKVIRSIGVECHCRGDQIFVKSCLESESDSIEADEGHSKIQTSLRNPVHVETRPYPGFPTDLQAQLMSLLTQVSGKSSIRETVFENRFMHSQELIRLGADIQIYGQKAIICGASELIGAPVMATDLRASASLILAGLVARGQTTVNRVYHLNRGYEKLEEKLSKLGAVIKRVS